MSRPKRTTKTAKKMPDNEKVSSRLIGKGINVRLYWTDLVWVAGIACYFIVSLELFYRMIVDYNGKYESDMHYYAVTTVTNGDRHARFVEILSQALYNINHNTMEFNIYLAAVMAAIIVVNYIVVCFFLRYDGAGADVPRYAAQIISLIVIFVGPLYIPVLHEWYYMNSFRSFAWHNPTHQTMLVFSMLCMLCFLRMFFDYENRISPGWWMGTMVFAFLSAAAKPSFIIDFVIAVVLFFIVELFIGGKEGFAKRFAKLFIMGCSIVPAGLYTIFLSTFEFGDTTVNGGEYHVIFGLKVLREQEDILYKLVFGMMFAIIVFAANYRRFKDSKYFLTLLVFVGGVLQWLLLGETGSRANHGNFGWGRMYGDYFLNLVCLVLLAENIYMKDSVFNGDRRKRTIYFIAAGVVLVISLLSQLNYFRLILTGHGYMH